MDRLFASLNALVQIVEQRTPGVRGSILLLDSDGLTLRHGAAPSFPAEFCRAVDGIAIGPAAGSCGAAAFSGKPVISADIEDDPIWEGYRELLREYKIRSAWSTPILTSEGGVLGTFAMYFGTPRTPSDADVHSSEMAAIVASELIVRVRAEVIAREGEQRLAARTSELQMQTAELARRESAFRFLAESIPVHVWTAAPDGTNEFITDKSARYFGRSPAEFRGGGWESILHPDDVERTRDRWRLSLRTGRPFEIEYRLYCAHEGGYRWHLGRAQAQRDEQSRIVRWYGSATDIEDQKRTESVRDAALSEAEAARASEVAANQARARFVNIVSHELRTPLGAISGYVDLMLTEIRGSLNDEQRADLMRMSVNVRHMRKLIDDILLLARLEADQLPIHSAPVQLNDILAAAMPMVEPQLRAKGISCDVRVDPPELMVMVDTDRLHQIVINLVANAIKFTPTGGSIVIECSGEANEVRILVRDTGVGIPIDKLGQIFEPFVQLPMAGTSSEGTGLGLAISRELARRMQGDLVAESGGSGGAAFMLTLPRWAPAVGIPSPLSIGRGSASSSVTRL